MPAWPGKIYLALKENQGKYKELINTLISLSYSINLSIVTSNRKNAITVQYSFQSLRTYYLKAKDKFIFQTNRVTYNMTL